MPLTGNVYNAKELQPAFPQERAYTLAINLGPNLTLAEATTMAQSTVDGKWYPYIAGGANGLSIPRLFLKHPYRTDAQGNCVMGDQLPGNQGQVLLTAYGYYAGDFRRGDLAANFDANAQTVMGGRWIVNRGAAGDVYRLP